MTADLVGEEPLATAPDAASRATAIAETTAAVTLMAPKSRTVLGSCRGCDPTTRRLEEAGGGGEHEPDDGDEQAEQPDPTEKTESDFKKRRQLTGSSRLPR
jgi:hypothetical protein